MNKSKELFEQAKQVIPGGVNSPVRAFRSVGRDPLFIASGKGSRIRDVDGNEYIDYVGSWGPLILGHTDEEVLDAVREAASRGTSFGAPTEQEVQLAEKITEMVPSVEKVRLVNSGTEATMSAIRLARGVTGRDKIIKFEGCYHGHGDSFLIQAGSGALTLGEPNSPGVPADLARLTVSATFNDSESVQALFEAFGSDIAAVIVEPVAGNMGVIPPQRGYLEGVRRITHQYGSMLILDEVMTGIRVHPGGAQSLYDVQPDLTTMGKVIGGGLPVGAYGGRAEIMEQVAPSGPVYQAGTLSGNPLAAAAGLKTLEIISRDGFFNDLNRKSEKLFDGIRATVQKLGLGYTLNYVNSMGCLFFTENEVTGFADALKSDTARFAEFFGYLLDEGVYIAPSQFEAMFVSSAHSEKDIDITLEKMEQSLRKAMG